AGGDDIGVAHQRRDNGWQRTPRGAEVDGDEEEERRLRGSPSQCKTMMGVASSQRRRWNRAAAAQCARAVERSGGGWELRLGTAVAGQGSVERS
ncbi:hypothetical protein E2562_016115, partial [Oryza meyeriana var. granulata]